MRFDHSIFTDATSPISVQETRVAILEQFESVGDCSVESRTWNFKLLDWSIQKDQGGSPF